MEAFDLSSIDAGDNVVEAFDVASSPNVAVSGAQVTINPSSDLSQSTDYYVQIAATCFDDAVGNDFAGILDKSV